MLIIINIFKCWLPVNEFPHPKTILLIDMRWHPQWGRNGRCQRPSELLAPGVTDPLRLHILYALEPPDQHLNFCLLPWAFRGSVHPLSSTGSIFPSPRPVISQGQLKCHLLPPLARQEPLGMGHAHCRSSAKGSTLSALYSQGVIVTPTQVRFLL